MKNSGSFHTFAQNIDLGYLLEPPWWGGSNEYSQFMFLSRNKKINVYPCQPQFYGIKVEFQGVKTIKACFRNDRRFDVAATLYHRMPSNDVLWTMFCSVPSVTWLAVGISSASMSVYARDIMSGCGVSVTLYFSVLLMCSIYHSWKFPLIHSSWNLQSLTRDSWAMIRSPE